MKPKLIILIGPPCSGKSTWSKNYIRNNQKTLRFNRDEIRLMLSGLPFLDTLGEHVVTAMIDIGIKDAISSKRDVILDQTNCRLSYINKYINLFENNALIFFKIFRESLSQLWLRNKERAIKTGIPEIPAEVIKNMYHNQRKMIESDEFKKILEIHSYE
jgi:predicted kinase